MRSATSFLVLGVIGLATCRDWDRYDPRLGADATVETGGAGEGGTNSTVGGAGGTPCVGECGGGGAGGSQPLGCNKVTLLGDDFEDGSLASIWDFWISGAGTLSESGGSLALGVQPSGGNVAFYSRYFYDLSDSSFTIALADLATLSPDAYFYISLHHKTNNYLQIGFETGQLVAGYHADGWTQVAYPDIDPTAHRHLRLRHEGALVHWEASPDGIDWTLLGSAKESDLFPLDHLQLNVNLDSGGSAGEAIAIEDIGGGVATGEHCGIDSFSDDFDDGAMAFTWETGWNDIGCTATETGGVLSLTIDAGASGGCGYDTLHLFDLTGRRSSVEVVDVAESDEAEMFFAVKDAVGHNGALFEIDGGTLAAFNIESEDWKLLTSVPYDATIHRYLALREEGGTVFFAVSGNGTEWSDLTSVSPSFDPSAVAVVLQAATLTSTMVHSMAWDNFNVPGP